MDSKEKEPVHGERAYWTHEVSERLGVGESTLRKWCIELEKNGYSFVKGEQESRAFLERDILVLMRLKELIRVERKSVKEAAKTAAGEARTPPVHDNIDLIQVELPEIVPPVRVERVEPLFTLEDVRKIVREELQERDRERVGERDEALMSVLREMQEVKRLLAASQVNQRKWWEFWRQK